MVVEKQLGVRFGGGGAGRRRRTRVGLGDGRRVGVAQAVADGRDDDHGDGAGGADDAGPEEGGALARGPAPVAEGCLPEEGRWSGHFGKAEFICW